MGTTPRRARPQPRLAHSPADHHPPRRTRSVHQRPRRHLRRTRRPRRSTPRRPRTSARPSLVRQQLTKTEIRGKRILADRLSSGVFRVDACRRPKSYELEEPGEAEKFEFLTPSMRTRSLMSADVAGRGRIPVEWPESNGLVGPMWPHADRRWLPTWLPRPTERALVCCFRLCRTARAQRFGDRSREGYDITLSERRRRR